MLIGIDCRLWNQTGVGRYIRNLVWELAKIDSKNKYILFFKENEYKNVIIPNGNFQKKLINIHWHSIKEQLFLPNLLLKENLDIIHFPYFSVPIFYTKPFVITIHDLIINHYSTGKASTRLIVIYWMKVLAYKIVLFFAIINARKIIAVSNTTKQEIIYHYKKYKQKIVVILEGVDKKITDKGLGDKNFKEKYFLYVGNAYPHKNLESILHALLKFKNHSLEFKVIFVGKEDFFYQKLKQKVKDLDLTNKILFYEKVSDAGLANLYKNAIALIIPSFMEGFGLPILEAMEQGCPVLCSDIDSFREVASSAALYFNPNDPEDIKNKLEYIFNNTQIRNDLISKGLERAKFFSWEKMAKETLGVYEAANYKLLATK